MAWTEEQQAEAVAILTEIASEEDGDVLIEVGSRFAVACFYCGAPGRWDDGAVEHTADCLYVRAKALVADGTARRG